MAYSRRHYRAVSPPADTAADVAARIRRNAILDQVRREREAAWPVIDATNVDAALAFQERRYAELAAQEGHHS